MLSILIPIYNYPVYDLVSKLASLCTLASIEFEIICIDDASTEFVEENKILSNIPHVSYSSLATNIGRSALRNRLVRQAKYDNLLLLDTDMKVISEDYIQNYLNLSDQYEAVYGGIIYENEVNSSKHALRWKYGSKVEACDAQQRNKDPFFSTKSCNLFIKKTVFNEIQFNEEVKGYGHEDTLFSVELYRKQIRIAHINNQVSHLGVERSDIYLNKVENGCKNLVFISNKFLNNTEREHIRLIYFYQKLNKMGVIPILNYIYSVFEKRIIRNLLSEDPALLLLDYYKLIKFSREIRKKN